MKRRALVPFLAVALASLAAGCSDDDSGMSVREGAAGGRVFFVPATEQGADDALLAFLEAGPGDTIEFDCGFFDLPTAMVLQSTENVRIQGCGIDETVLSFRNSDSPEGILAVQVDGLWIEDLTVVDSPGDGIKLSGVRHATLTNVRAMWSGAFQPVTAENYEEAVQVPCTAPPASAEENVEPREYNPRPDTGRYGIYPVQAEDVILDGVESIGASDAGIYVGQTNRSIVRNSRAAYNVMGFEIENVQGGEYVDNVAECNTGGFLVYDLPNLNQYGDRTLVHGNRARNNNTYNFTTLGGFIAAVPRGSGLLLLAYDRIEVFDNVFEEHDTASIIIVSYDILGGENDRKLDPYAEGISIHDNTFRNSGYDLPPPDWQRVLDGDQSTLLPAAIGLKNQGVGAHIVFDGIVDRRNDCPYPDGADGLPVPFDGRGKPQFTAEDPNPDCRYNRYKFDDGTGELRLPDWGLCIDDSNVFETDHVDDAGEPIPPFANFRGTSGLEILELLDDPSQAEELAFWLDVIRGLGQFAAIRDASPHDCEARFGETPEPLDPVVVEPFVSEGAAEPGPTEAEIAALCGGEPTEGDINRAALAVNCPDLADYRLFADPLDPRSTPNGGGVPFVLNSKLFSDHAVKYRVAFVPPGQPAQYRDRSNGENVPIHFPVGTVLAKTFAFRDGDDERVVETRLLIKRGGEGEETAWIGLPYIWESGEDGTPVARLSSAGGRAAVRWNYVDADGGERLAGSTERYAIPHVNQCITCHANSDLTAGSAPIGPKPRNLNRPYVAESDALGESGQAGFPAVNQLQDWRDRGLLVGGPADLGVDPETRIAANAERSPRWNVPGDSGEPAGSHADLEARVRSYLEINCQHCHNVRGAASNTGLFLRRDSVIAKGEPGANGTSFGICKGPTAAGGGTGGRPYAITPGDPGASIVPFRMAANDPQARMPPLARSVAHDGAVALIEQWIAGMDGAQYDGTDDAGACN